MNNLTPEQLAFRAGYEQGRFDAQVETSTPASKPWVGLTDEEISKLIDNEIGFNSCCGWEEEYTRAVEAKLKAKNSL